MATDPQHQLSEDRHKDRREDRREDLPEGPQSPRRLHVLLVLLMTFVVYARSMGNGFAMDDMPLAESVTKANEPDPMIATLRSPVDYFTQYYWYPDSGNDRLYRPVTVMSYALTYNWITRLLDPDVDSRDDEERRRLEALPHHVINVLLHVWATWLVLRLVLALGLSGFTALLTAALFGLHAIHSEVVAGIVGRAEMLAFVFGGEAMLLLARRVWMAPVSAALLLFLAFCSKEGALAWIGFLPCYLLARGFLSDPRRPILEILRPHLVPGLWATLVPLVLFFSLRCYTIHVLRADDLVSVAWSSNPLFHETFLTRVCTGVMVWGYGLWQCVAPFRLSCLYSPQVFTLVESPFDVGFFAALVVLLAFLVAGLVWARRQPLLFLAMATFLGFSFMTSNVLVATGTIFGERLYYTPSLGICMLPAVLLPLMPSRLATVFLFSLCLWIPASAMKILERNPVWQNSDVLFKHDVTVRPRCADLHMKAAVMYSTGSHVDLNKGEEHIREAIRLQPDFPIALGTLADIQMQRSQWRAALETCERALGCQNLPHSGAEPTIYNRMGVIYRKLGDEARSIQAFLKGFEAPGGRRQRDAYIGLAQHAAGKVPQPKLAEVCRSAWENLPYDAEVMVMTGALAYKINLPNPQVLALLERGFRYLKPQKRRKEFVLKAQMLFADVLVNQGMVARDAASVNRGIQIFQGLVQEPGFPAELKRQIAAKLRKLQAPR